MRGGFNISNKKSLPDNIKNECKKILRSVQLFNIDSDKEELSQQLQSFKKFSENIIEEEKKKKEDTENIERQKRKKKERLEICVVGCISAIIACSFLYCMMSIKKK